MASNGVRKGIPFCFHSDHGDPITLQDYMHMFKLFLKTLGFISTILHSESCCLQSKASFLKPGFTVLFGTLRLEWHQKICQVPTSVGMVAHRFLLSNVGNAWELLRTHKGSPCQLCHPVRFVPIRSVPENVPFVPYPSPTWALSLVGAVLLFFYFSELICWCATLLP